MKTTSKMLTLFISALTLGCCSLFYSSAQAQWCDSQDMTCMRRVEQQRIDEAVSQNGGYNGTFDSGDSSQPNIIYLPTKPSQYGAVALNSKTGAYGYSSNESTAQRSKTAAIADCGQSGCKIIAHYSNQCVAFAWGLIKTGSFSPVDVDLNQSIAEQKAMATCDARARECKIIYSGCSLP